MCSPNSPRWFKISSVQAADRARTEGERSPVAIRILSTNYEKHKQRQWISGQAGHGVIGPYFFENEERITMTVTLDRYVEMLQSFVAPALNNFQQLHEAWFQQDGATSHTAKQSMAAVQELFGNRVISRFGDIPWPPRSPDLSVCDFFLWGYLKNRVYTTRPRTMDELKQRIQDEIRGIPTEMLLQAMGNLNGRLKECICTGGRHLQDVIFRHW